MQNVQIVPINVTVEVTNKSGYIPASVAASVQTALDQYLHPDYWAWGETVYYNELISLIDQVDGVDRVVSLSMTDPDPDPNYTAVTDTVNLTFSYYGCLPTHVSSVTVSS